METAAHDIDSLGSDNTPHAGGGSQDGTQRRFDTGKMVGRQVADFISQ